MSLKDSIAANTHVKVQAVDVPEWGLNVYVRELSVKDRASLFAKAQDDKEKPNLPVWMCVYCLCDKDGKREFVEGDFDTLAEQPAGIVDRVAKAASELNSLTVADAKKN